MIRSEVPRRLRVLHLVTDLAIGGTPGVLANLVTRLDRRKYDLAVGCLKRRTIPSAADELEPAGVPLRFLDGRGGYDVRVLWRLRSLLRDEPPHLIHSWLFHANLAARLLGRRVPVRIASIRGLDRGKGRLQVLLDRWLQDRDHRMVVNAESARHVLGRRERYPAERIVLIRNGVDAKHFQEDVPPAPLPHPGPVIVSVGRLHPDKGHRTLLQALPAIRARHPEAWVLLVGDEGTRSDRPTLERLARALGVGGAVMFAGIREDVRPYLRAAAVVSLPSEEEAMANAALEALAAGRPVVATDVGDMRSAVLDGVTGLLCPPRDPRQLAEAIGRLLDDPERARQMGRAGRRHVEEHFPVAAMVEEMERLYDELIRERLSLTPAAEGGWRRIS